MKLSVAPLMFLTPILATMLACGDEPAGPSTSTVTVELLGTGAGDVTFQDNTCPTRCAATVDDGTSVTLTATAATSSDFTGWEGGCTGAGACTLTVGADVTVRARFTLRTTSLQVGRTGDGAGEISSAPSGIDCGTTCSATFNHGDVVTLTAAATEASSTFDGWSGEGCSGTGDCVVTMDQPRNVTADFGLSSELTVTLAGVGAADGSVTSIPPGIECPGTCTESFARGTMITLTAAVAADARFDGWSGAGCTGTGDCVVTLDAAGSVTATFSRTDKDLAVTLTGASAQFASVTSAPAGIDCPGTCTASFSHGQAVTLTATPTAGEDSQFNGWTGEGCDTSECIVTMDAARAVSADFGLADKNLFVVKRGNGAELGSVTSDPAGIDCGLVCDADFPHGSQVTLTHTVPTGVDLTLPFGYEGCTGNVCDVTLMFNSSWVPTFTLQKRTLTVAVEAGVGTITVSNISPSPIDCPGTCSAEIDFGTSVTLLATPGPAHLVGSWSGACAGAGTATECTVLMDDVRDAGVTFNSDTHQLEVMLAGDGLGGLAPLVSSDTGVDCYVDGTGCTDVIAGGTMLTLTATPPPWATFDGWEGDCSGSATTCDLTMDRAMRVNATFSARGNLAFVASAGLVGGNLGGLAGADGICATAAADQSLPGTYVAWLSSSDEDAITRLQAQNATAGGWVRPDGLRVASNIADLTDGWLDSPMYALADGSQATNLGCVSNTDIDGTRLESVASNTCGDWTVDGDAAAHRVAICASVSNEWTVFGTSLNACWSFQGVYCLQTNLSGRYVPPAPTGPYFVFLSHGTIDGGQGRAAMDALCQAEADDGSVTSAAGGTYVAWLTDDNEVGGARVDLSQQYMLPSGALISASALGGDGSAPYPESPINYDVEGLQSLAPSAWVGGVQHCANWTDINAFGETGDTHRSDRWVLSPLDPRCWNELPLYCYRAQE